ncbi:MAG: hypothetical protein PHY54_19815 [Methylococcales bacterium]|nr:hypothetical protein [Methylococcales bacterium]
MKKFKNLFVMVMVLVVMVVLTGACKTADVDPVEDDIQFVSVSVAVVERFDDRAHVVATFVFSVRVSAPTRLEGEAYVGESKRLLGADVFSTGLVTIAAEKTSHKFGTHKISGHAVLLSNGKMAIIPDFQFTVS